jgi:TraM recognition site of TraD and TraG
MSTKRCKATTLAISTEDTPVAMIELVLARETGPPIGESADGLPKAEPACEKAEGSELDSLGPHVFFEDDLDTVHFESEREVISPATEDSPRCVDAGIEVVQVSEGVFQGRFTLQLASVSSAALATDHAKWSESGTIVQGEAARQRALASLACSLRPSQRIRFVHLTSAHVNQSLRYRMLIEGEALARDTRSAAQQARELLSSLRPTLAVGADQFGFEGQSLPELRDHRGDCVELVPAAIAILRGAGVAAGTMAHRPDQQALLPMVPNRVQTFLDSVVAGLTSLPAPTRLVIEWRGLPVDARVRSFVEQDVRSLLDVNSRLVRLVRPDGLGGEVPPEDLHRTHRVLQGWLAEPLGALMFVRIQSAAPVPPTLARMIGHELFLGRPFAICRATDDYRPFLASPFSDLGGLVTRDMPMPPLFPQPLSVDAQGFERRFPVVEFDMPAGGIVLGDSSCRGRDREIRFADHDRGQHCYVAGQTGSGKTRGLLEPMALQDMARGDGVFYPDMDGDSFDYLHAACPPARRADIVSLDFTDFVASPALNLLQFQTRWPRIERGFIVDNLVQIFKHQYPDTPEGFGPIFELYLTNAAYLVMEEPGSTVLDIVRVFADVPYRRRLLSICKDPLVAEFWRHIAVRAGGDASLENIAPYIVSKLTKMVDDELVKRVVGQAESTINFRAGMDARKIFLIKLSKGLLSERGARFLGMLLTSRLFAAALSRADTAPHLRVPCHVYLDEFQNLVSPAIEGMLAESRKYGLRLTLANQNLAQLPSDLSQSVLTNCGTKIIMRTGLRDAELLAPWVAPHFGESDLLSLPNRHAVARVMVNGVLSPSFAMRTRTMPNRERSPEVDARVASIRAESRQRYCVDADVIDQRIAAKRAECAEGARQSEPPGVLERLAQMKA